MLLSTSNFLATTSPSSIRQIEALIEGRLVDHARYSRHLRGQTSGVDLSGLDLAYRSAHHSEFDFLGSLCTTCSDFPLWLQHTTSEELEPFFFCLGPLRHVARRSPCCRLCRLVLQSITLGFGVFDDIFLIGGFVTLHPRGKAAFDIKLSPSSAATSPTPDPTILPQWRFHLNLPPHIKPSNPLHSHITSLTPGKFLKLFDTHILRVVTTPPNTAYCALRYNAQGTYTSCTTAWVAHSTNPDYLTRWIHLPTSVRDAIAITKRLNHRYLWIDWICDGPVLSDPEEAREYLSHLPSILSRAEFVISASIGMDNTRPGLAGLYNSLEFPLHTAQFGRWSLTSCLFNPIEPPRVTRNVWYCDACPWKACFDRHGYRGYWKDQRELEWGREVKWGYETLVLGYAEEEMARRVGRARTVEKRRKGRKRVVKVGVKVRCLGSAVRRLLDSLRGGREAEDERRPLLDNRLF
ncbi:hypothetical protein B0T14DRAFT_569272 [Immersiella caudata]|uniref:Heterokaryon incompatibility domain-containing protein n=1 Tax=Immersiella caudata TaxID=314043 RepID=A0AA39WB43_9PEZI|nr:hypothetical protein B0T14DRAFT_569272 [Immersiella caudata]